MHTHSRFVTRWQPTPSFYTWTIGSLCLLYLAIQLGFISYAKLTVDDFWLSYHTYQFKSLLPYRDFSPYKTTLGYYILLLPLSLFHGVIMPLLCTKAFMAFINAVGLTLTSVWMRRFFPAPAIIASLLIVVFSQFFLNYSAEIRVDMLGYWVCLISLLCLLEKRFLLAGLLAGVSFGVSQKTLWYIIATDFALGAYWYYRDCAATYFRQLVTYNIAALSLIIVYIAFWACFAGWHTVLHNVFYEAYLVFSIDSYNFGRLVLWQFILQNNSLYFMLLPLALVSLFVLPERDNQQGVRLWLTVLAAVILSSMASYKQPFPYNVPATFPAFFVLYAALFSWLFALLRAPVKMPLRLEAGVFCFLYLYIFGLVYLIHLFALPLPRLFICLVPLSVAFSLMVTQYRSIVLAGCTLTLAITGVALPAYNFTQLLPELNGHYQKYMLNLADALLQEGGDYVAGVPLFYNRHQPIPGLKHIVLPALDYLYHPATDKLPVMNLPSLYLTPDTTDQIIESLKNADVKLYVNNERLHSTPPAIQQFLDTQYQHFWGSIYLYAPQVEAGLHRIKIKFTGWYRVDGPDRVTLNNYLLTPGSEINLSAGNYSSSAKQPYRLTWVPAILPERLATQYKNDDWQQTLE